MDMLIYLNNQKKRRFLLALKAEVSSPSTDEYFDFIYARLVLHYLPKKDLIKSLEDLYRVLVNHGKIFIVVRSIDCIDATDRNASYDPETCMTTYSSQGTSLSRYFHSEKSIQEHLTIAGFRIQKVHSYEEILCSDFKRMHTSKYPDALIEVVGIK